MSVALRIRLRWALCIAAAWACCVVLAARAQTCVPAGKWALPAALDTTPVDFDRVLRRASASEVVLLGEMHDQAEHHRWQLHMISALQAVRGPMVLGFEMFPRRVQPVLDRWVAGELSEMQLLQQTDWPSIWGFDSALYLPLFHFARMHRLPMVALNVDRALIREVGRKGAAGVSESLREGVGQPAPAPAAYEKYLFEIFLHHDGAKADATPNAVAFRRFVDSQTLWDRAMAEAIRDARRRFPGRQVIGIMGSGHTLPGAVPHQLRALGIAGTMVMRPWDANADCGPLSAGLADAVFGIDTRHARDGRERPRPRLGVALSAVEGGVRIDQVGDGSVAAQAGLRVGDVVLTIAGLRAASTAEVVAVIGRQAPGTWLPLRVRRDEREIEIVARFPPAAL